jgi:type IV secretion system protein VirD4
MSAKRNSSITVMELADKERVGKAPPDKAPAGKGQGKDQAGREWAGKELAGPARLTLGRAIGAAAGPGFLSMPGPASGDLVTYDGDGHCLTIAPTGGGKGVSSVIPNALLYPGPVIVFDPKGESVAVAKRRREQLGHEVVVLDPFGVTGAPSGAFNPMDLADTIDPGRPEDAAATLATLLTGGQASHRDPFWDNTSTAFLSGLNTWLLADCTPDERRYSCLFDLFADCNMANGLACMMDGEIIRNKSAEAEMAAFLSLPERETRPSVQASARQHLAIFGSPAVRAVTDRTSFDVQALVDGGPVSLFIVIPPTKLLSHRAVVRLWLGALILALGARRQMPARRTLMLIDEAGQLGRMEPLLQTATLLRGTGVTLWTFFQSPAQLESIYGPDAMVLADNAGVIQLFAPRNGRVADAYARLLGDVSPEAVMQLGPDEQMLLVDGGRSFRCRRLSYLDDPLCRGLADPNPMHAQPVAPRAARQLLLGMRDVSRERI